VQGVLQADHVIKGVMEIPDGLKKEQLTGIIRNNNIKCPELRRPPGRSVRFQPHVQHLDRPGQKKKGYLRPETAQGMFVDFPRLLRFYREKLPFGVTQIGKSYRNEISPRQGVIRLREFTQAEAEIFVHPEKKEHPRFSRYSGYRMPLLGIRQQQEGTPAVEMTMQEAVDAGVVAHSFIAYYLALTHDLLVTVGVRPERLRFRQHLPEERAHYAVDCWDAEVYSGRFGWVETVGIADRTDYDLRAHEKQSGERFSVFISYPAPRKESRVRVVPRLGRLGPLFRGRAKAVAEALEASAPKEGGITVTVEGEEVFVPPDLYEVREEVVEVPGEDVTPHVIEPSYGIDRMIYAVLEHSYAEEVVKGEERRVLHLPPRIAPIQAAVFPLMNRDGLPGIGREILEDLASEGIVAEFDDSGAIGRRYRRNDEIGTPFAVTVDYETLEEGTVTIRDRDSMEQVKVPRWQVADKLAALLSGSLNFQDAGVIPAAARKER